MNRLRHKIYDVEYSKKIICTCCTDAEIQWAIHSLTPCQITNALKAGG